MWSALLAGAGVWASTPQGQDFRVVAPLRFLRPACKDIRVPVIQDLGDVAGVGP